LKKRLTLSVSLSACLVVTIVFAIFAQGQPVQTPVTTAQAPSGGWIDYVNGANVGLQLPPPGGNNTHPENLKLLFTDINASTAGDVSPGNDVDVMQVQIWVQAMNAYVPVAVLTTNTNQTSIARVQSILNGTPIWNPPTVMNFFVPTKDQLQIYVDSDGALFANLTTSVNITLPTALGGNFTLPPMNLMFRPIAPGFAHNETTVLAKPTYSGWTIQQMHTDVPAWVRVVIPMWVAISQVETVGTMTANGTATYIPPR
jgi:hypothetical protein